MQFGRNPSLSVTHVEIRSKNAFKGHLHLESLTHKSQLYDSTTVGNETKHLDIYSAPALYLPHKKFRFLLGFFAVFLNISSNIPHRWLPKNHYYFIPRFCNSFLAE